MRIKSTDIAMLPHQWREQIEGKKPAVPSTVGQPKEPKPRLRQKAGPKLNKTEQRFEIYLRQVFKTEPILAQSITLEIANGCRYTPDFVVIQPRETPDAYVFRAYEVKGPHMWDDSIVKLKVAARSYPWIQFNICSRSGFGWRIERIHP